MDAVFLRLLNMSITASWLILAVVVLRRVLNRAPKVFRLVMWALVGLRLICPFSFESIVSLIPSAEALPYDTVYSNSSFQPDFSEIIEYAVDNPVDYELGIQNGSIVFNEFSAPDTQFLNPLLITTKIATVIWLIGIAAMLLYAVLSYVKIKGRVKEAIPFKDNVMVCDRIDTPFILGLIKPEIYLPFGLNETEIPYILAHEQAHLKRLDHIWKPLGFALLTVYWFNPVIWLAYILLCRDIELICDERVIKELGEDSKKEYSTALLNCSVPRKSIAACPLAFGETDIKGRIKSVLTYKKPAVITVIIAVIAIIITSVCLLTNPVTDKNQGNTDEFVPVDHGVIYSADINEDGVKEDISITEEYEDVFKVVFTDKNGETVWTENLSWTHPDWNSIHICNIDGKDYILRYNPYMSTGLGSYHYEMFTVHNGEQKTLKENRVSFSINAARFELPIDELVAFDEEINGYLKNSTLIVSTLDGKAVIGAKNSEGFFDSFSFWLKDPPLGEIDTEKGTLREKLQLYSRYMMGYLNSETEPIYSADINADGINEYISVVKSGEYKYNVFFSDTDGEVIWEESIGTDNPRAHSIHICSLNGKDYIMKYNSYMGGGMGIYVYEIYNIENSEKKTVFENSVSFDIFGIGALPVDEFIAFEKEISHYFDNSTLILSTLGETIIGPVKSESFDSTRYDWLYENDLIKIDRNKGTFREHLQEYSDYITVYHKTMNDDLNNVIYSADINLDGKDEIISLTKDEIGEYKVVFTDIEGNDLWEETDFDNFMGNAAGLYICYLDGNEYILRYQQYYHDGCYNYDYELYTLNKSEKKVVRSNHIEFDTLFPQYSSVDDMTDFYKEINGYLKNSTLLISSIDYKTVSGPEAENLNDGFSWLWESGIEGVDTEKREIRKSLEAYRDFMLKYQNLETGMKYDGETHYSADINHDGEDELIAVIQSSPHHEYSVIFTDKDKNILWIEDEFSLAHVGWNSLHICNIDGKDYILQYNPYVAQGYHTYGYELYTIENGKKKVRYSDTVEFDIEGREHLPVEDIIRFKEGIDGYLESSTLLISTLTGDIVTGPTSSKGFDGNLFYWAYEDGNHSTLEEALRAYDKKAYEEWRTVHGQ